MGLASVVTWWCLATATWQGAAGERVMMATEYEAKEPLLREGHRVDPLAAYARLSMLVAQRVREGADQKGVLRDVLHQVLGQHRRRRPQEKRFVTSPSGRLEKDALKDWLTWRIRREAAQAMLQSLDTEGGAASFVRKIRRDVRSGEGGDRGGGEVDPLAIKEMSQEKQPREGESEKATVAQRGRVRREDPAVMYVPVGGAAGADSCPDSVDAAAVSISQLVFLSLSLGVFSAVANIANNINNNNDNNNNNNDNNINSNNLNLAANANSGNQITVQLPPPTGRKRRHLQLLWERHLAALRGGATLEEEARRGAPTRSRNGAAPSHPRSEDDVAPLGTLSEGDVKASGPRREPSSGDEAPEVSASLMSLTYEDNEPHDRQELRQRAPDVPAKGPEVPLKQSSRESSPTDASSTGTALTSSPPPSRLSSPLRSSNQAPPSLPAQVSAKFTVKSPSIPHHSLFKSSQQALSAPPTPHSSPASSETSTRARLSSPQVMLRNSPIIQHSSQGTLSSPAHLSSKSPVSPLSSQPVIHLSKSPPRSSHAPLSSHNRLSSNAQSPPKPTLATPQSSNNSQSPHSTPNTPHNSQNSSQTSPHPPPPTPQPSRPSPPSPQPLPRLSSITLKTSHPSTHVSPPPLAPSPPTCRNEGVAATWALKGIMAWLLTSPRPLPPCLGLHLCGLVQGAGRGGAWINALAGYYLLTALHEHTSFTFSDFLKEAKLGTCRRLFPGCEEVLKVSGARR
ncbi:uncharacterized protein [Penaeus vannamei]|uniref:uncharacterized protein n=1 Tax=Penaeus vannamei TaxID=6689 RepID=UPI00387F3F55